MKDDPPHVALAKARILADLRYLDVWKADLIRDIMLLEKPTEYVPNTVHRDYFTQDAEEVA